MTPEQKTALERLRRFVETGESEFTDPHNGWQQREYVACLERAANVALDEHPDGEDEPVTLEELRRAARECDIQLIVIQDGTVDVWGTVRPKTRGQLRALLKGLGQ